MRLPSRPTTAGTGPVGTGAVVSGGIPFSRRNPWVLNSGDLLLHVLAFYVMLAPTGAALSVDRWLKERGGLFDFPPRSVWPLRLMQIQLTVL